jgi:hypothetical protein
MNLRSAVVAMLWEQWRLSRVEGVQRLFLGLLAASGALLLNQDNGVTVAVWILAAAHGFFWFSIAKLNGGRFMDGYKPGFPLYLLYTRPLPTALVVGVSMAYDALSCAALYILSAALLGAAFGKPLPMFSVAACLVAYHLVSTCIQWSTQNRIVQWVGSIAIFWPLVGLLKSSLDSPDQGRFTLAQGAMLVLLGLVSFGLTVAGVARQRRGDAVAQEPRKEIWGGYPEWMVNLVRFSCPTSSAMKAQLWFELRSSGLPVLTIGLSLAVLICLLFAAGIVIAPLRTVAMGITVFSFPFVLFFCASNAFGIRSKQGRLYAGTFETTQPYGTAQLAALKVLVRSACVLIALATIAASVWASSSFMGAWGAWSAGIEGGVNAVPELLKFRGRIGDAIAGQSGWGFVALAAVVSIGVAGLVAWQSAREALRVRYARRVLVAQWAPAAWGLSIGLATLAGKTGFIAPSAVRSIVQAAMWLPTAALLLATIYFLRSNVAERVLTVHYVAGALAILAAFGAAYATLLAGAWLGGAEPTLMALLSWPVLLLMMGGALAPWALNRVRHT